MKVFVLGAGVGGLAFASLGSDLDISVIDKNSEAGRKLLATGNGRCNFTNQNFGMDFYQSDNKNFPKKALENFTNKDLIDYFYKLGIDSTSLPSGRTYPATMSAKTVRDILYLEARKNASFIFDEEIKDIDLRKKLLISETNKYKYDILVIASGGITLPRSGSDGSVFKILKEKIPVTKLTYAITNYKTREKFSKKSKGTKVTAKASLFVDNKFIKASIDDLIFQDYGLTGTAIFNISNEISLALREGKEADVRVDFFPTYSKKDLGKRLGDLFERNPHRKIKEILLGLVNEKIISDILKRSSIANDKKANKINNGDLDVLLRNLKAMKFTIEDIHDKTNAQVSLGGFDTRFVDKATMKSRLYDDVYIIGEALDVSGSCGGYNIQWAFSSAIAAVKSIRSLNV
ncbi:MAG: aminoacetone oxidase family FAD-binding enzyme [Peptoniphilaceae bacterium]|nr:aminoacetone oxidase family FAD-binding enzyme [Peptoniphilaceae bacterium]